MLGGRGNEGDDLEGLGIERHAGAEGEEECSDAEDGGVEAERGRERAGEMGRHGRQDGEWRAVCGGEVVSSGCGAGERLGSAEED